MKSNSISASLLIFAGAIVFGGIFLAQHFFKGYSAKENTISALGQKVDPFNSSTKSSIIFNSAMIIAGLAIFIAAYLLNKNNLNSFFCIVLMVHGIFTAGVGLVPSTIKPFHLIIALVTFLSVELASIISYNFGSGFTQYLLAFFGAFSFIFLIAFLFISKKIGEGLSERLIVYPTTIWLIIFGLFLLNKK